MTTSNQESLRVREMRVIWRDTFVVERPGQDFLSTSRARLGELASYVADSQTEPRSAQPPLLRMLERVSRSVAGIGHPNLLRVQFAPLEMANLRPTLIRLRRSPHKLTADEVRDAAGRAEAGPYWLGVTPVLVLHRAGAGIVQYHGRLVALEGGYPPDKAIELVRLGIQSQLLKLPQAWRDALPPDVIEQSAAGVVSHGQGSYALVAGLRDLSASAIAARLESRPRTRRGSARTAREPAAARPTGSTTVVLVDVDPAPPRDLTAFVNEHADTLRGIGALDTYYRERADWIVGRELADNLSTDRELGVFLLGNSELMLFNDELPSIVNQTRARMSLASDELAATYHYMHYGVLLEWIYLQGALLRSYLRQLDALAVAATPRRREMIAALQGALSDLVQYQEDITPFSTRVEFLHRARRYHKLDELAERFERKQELLLDYASEFHDYREARATQFLNWLAGILTGAALAELIVTLAGITPDQTSLYLGVTLGSIAVVLLALALLLRAI